MTDRPAAPERDRWDELAEQLLPCNGDSYCMRVGRRHQHHRATCPGDYRSAVAAGLRKAYSEGQAKTVGGEKENRDDNSSSAQGLKQEPAGQEGSQAKQTEATEGAGADQQGQARMTREICKRCGRDNPLGFSLPDDVWAAAVPERFRNRVLCIVCFDDFATRNGVDWTLDVEFWPYSGVEALRDGLAVTPIVSKYCHNHGMRKRQQKRALDQLEAVRKTVSVTGEPIGGRRGEGT